MQNNVRKMQSQLNRIAKAKTPAARSKAIGEHLRTLHENMRLAHSLEAGKGMDCPMAKEETASASDRNCMPPKEKSMDMMQQMMHSQEGTTLPMPMKWLEGQSALPLPILTFPDHSKTRHPS